MHRELKSLLHDAKGLSEFVVPVFLDVRGFSSFARLAESTEAAVFLKSIYIRILDDYFPEAAFFKPTGDGLLLVLSFEEHTLASTVNDAVATSLRVVDEFGDLCESDPMVNFDVPQALGVGISRGAATRLVSGEKTLDFSGRPLNLAARLMELARPKGVVFDAGLGLSLLDSDVTSQFSPEDVYVRGLADADPLRVFASADVVIPAGNRRPLSEKRWSVEKQELRFGAMKRRGLFQHRLRQWPLDPEAIEVRIRHAKVLDSGRPSRRMRSLPV